MAAQLVAAAALLLARYHPARIADETFDCQLRQLARTARSSVCTCGCMTLGSTEA